MARPMTNKEYAKSGGCRCPFCRGSDVQPTGAMMPDDRDGGTVEVECKGCGRAWRDVYRLVGYEAEEDGG